MKLATWNINSLRLRLPLVKRFTEEHAPDVLCLQETKVTDDLFPADALREMGYAHLAFRGEKSYNGVAILSRLPLTDIAFTHIAGVEDCRHLSARLPDGTLLHNFYIPAGGDIPDPVENPKFGHKLRFLDHLTEWLPTAHRADEKLLMVGDFNIAPLPQDVWSHKQLLNVVSHTPIEVEKLTRLQTTLGWRDAVRSFVPETEKSYSWWSYRARDWLAADRGRKLDHIWMTAPLHPRLRCASILKGARGWEQPSDHVPVIAEWE
jgi:exodeoxyribonuclease-3